MYLLLSKLITIGAVSEVSCKYSYKEVSYNDTVSFCFAVQFYTHPQTFHCLYLEANHYLKSWILGCFIEKVDLPSRILTIVIFLS